MSLRSAVPPLFVDTRPQQLREFRSVLLVVFALGIADHGKDKVLFRVDRQQCAASTTMPVASRPQDLAVVLQSDAILHVQFGKVRFE